MEKHTGWTSWAQYYSELVRRHGGRLYIDGHRNNGLPSNGFIENFYYVDPRFNINATFIGYFNSGGGRTPFSMGFNATLARGFVDEAARFPDRPIARPTFEDLVQLVRKNLGQFDVVVLNSGLWALAGNKMVPFAFPPSNPSFLDKLRRIYPLVEALVKDNGSPIWATTTPVHDSEVFDNGTNVAWRRKEYGLQVIRQSLGVRLSRPPVPRRLLCPHLCLPRDWCCFPYCCRRWEHSSWTEVRGCWVGWEALRLFASPMTWACQGVFSSSLFFLSTCVCLSIDGTGCA